MGPAGGLTLLGGWVALNFEALVDWAMTPKGPFVAAAVPAAPDYRSAAAWSALPERVDLADRAPRGQTAATPEDAAYDVFYVHPTTIVDGRWNGPVDDPTLNEITDRVATGIQAPAFNERGLVYAPRYRQANGTTFYRPTPDGDQALEVAYADVAGAFQEFLRRRGQERPFVLAGHSQGSVLAERLLRQVIADSGLRASLVAVYLPGGRVTAASLAEGAVPACEGPEHFACVVAFNARGPDYRPNRFEMARPDPRPLLCTNPLTGRSDERDAPAQLNLGAVFLESEDPSPRPAFAGARCQGGTLIVEPIGAAPRDGMSRILDWVIGPANHHPIEYQLFLMNLRRDVDQRHRAWREARAVQGAP